MESYLNERVNRTKQVFFLKEIGVQRNVTTTH